MPIFTKESLDQLRQRIDLVDVMSTHIDLKKSGASYKALCPFHDEKTPSFMIQKGDTHYHCFGCGAHGDAIQFLMTHLKMNFGDAVETLAQRFHVHLEVVEGAEEPKGPPKAALKDALQQAARFYHFFLLHTDEGHQALKYLYQRGLTLDFIRRFQIGFAPRSPALLREIMHAKMISDEVLCIAGLIAPIQNGRWKDFFSDRITFPIQDATGAIIGFSARKFKEETFGGKYINTAETPLFKKSRVLFGLSHSRRRIAKEHKAIIVEGQLDALRLIDKGFNLTVAAQGTAFGAEHVKELVNLGVQQVFLALDGDNAGREATFKVGDLFQKVGVDVQVVQLPEGSDPDSFLRQHGPEAFQQLLEKTIDYLGFIVGYMSTKFRIDSPAGKNQMIQAITQQIREWNEPVVVQESLRRLAHLTQISESLIGLQGVATPNLYIKKSAHIGLETIDPALILEGDFLRWLTLGGNSSFVAIAQDNLQPADLHVPVCQELYQAFLAQPAADLLTLAIQTNHPECQALLAQLSQKKVNREKALQHFQETVQKILDRNWMQKCEEIKTRIHSGQLSDEEALALVKDYNDLRRSPPKARI